MRKGKRVSSFFSDLYHDDQASLVQEEHLSRHSKTIEAPIDKHLQPKQQQQGSISHNEKPTETEPINKQRY